MTDEPLKVVFEMNVTEINIDSKRQNITPTWLSSIVYSKITLDGHSLSFDVDMMKNYLEKLSISNKRIRVTLELI